jgi:hypothetical protein
LGKLFNMENIQVNYPIETQTCECRCAWNIRESLTKDPIAGACGLVRFESSAPKFPVYVDDLDLLPPILDSLFTASYKVQLCQSDLKKVIKKLKKAGRLFLFCYLDGVGGSNPFVDSFTKIEYKPISECEPWYYYDITLT